MTIKSSDLGREDDQAEVNDTEPARTASNVSDLSNGRHGTQIVRSPNATPWVSDFDLRSSLRSCERRLMMNSLRLADLRKELRSRENENLLIRTRLNAPIPTVIRRSVRTSYRRIASRLRRSRFPSQLLLLFDRAFYLSKYQDVLVAEAEPFEHFLQFGAAEERDPNPMFSTSWYLEQHPDVKAAGINPLLHYLQNGAAEGRDPHPLFSTAWYVDQCPEILTTGENPLLHYLRASRTAPVST